jgi:hypothetical protein
MLPTLIFLGGAICGLIILATALIRHFQTINHVQECYRTEGTEWDYMSNLSLRKKLAFDSGFSFINDTDSLEVRRAKERMLKSRLEYKRAFSLTLVCFILGFLGSAICSIIQVPK